MSALIGWLIVMSIGVGTIGLTTLVIYTQYYFKLLMEEMQFCWELPLGCILWVVIYYASINIQPE